MYRRGNLLKKIIVEVARVIVGATFIFSGFVKGIDALGFQYKIQDYLVAMDLKSLFWMALPVAIFLIVLEFSLGVLLLLGVYRKWTTRIILLVMAFMTPLTLWIALKNPVKDCGCFGDAFIISNWATFYKNLVLIALTIILAINYKNIQSLYSNKFQKIVAVFTVIFAITFSIYGVVRLQIIDFRPYKIGSNIPQNMFIDPSESDVFENIFIYEKDGVKKEFTEKNYPWQDSTWTFVELKSNLVKEGKKPKIEDFNIQQLQFNTITRKWEDLGDISQQILGDPNYTLLMVATQLQDTKWGNLKDFNLLHELATRENIPFYLLTASSTEEIAKWDNQHPNFNNFTYCNSDERMLKTMIRSNPGLLLLKDGTVLNKWDGFSLPKKDKARQLIDKIKNNTYTVEKQNSAMSVLWIALFFIIPLIIIAIIDRRNNFLK